METVAVIDYGMGNLRSVQKALEYVSRNQQRVLVTNEKAAILEADRLVFPGQGALRDAMEELEKGDLIDVVKKTIGSRPFLGICLGLQALYETSEEADDVTGMSTFPGQVVRFPNSTDNQGRTLKVPHMGWNNVSQKIEHPLWNRIANDSYFYFVHSYFVEPVDKHNIAATSEYGQEFVCAVNYDSTFAVQFHPEKSQRAGLQLLSNFLQWKPG